MKIIADAGQDVLIVQATKKELAHVAGFSGVYADGAPKDMKPGVTIHVGDMYAKVVSIVAAGGKLKQAQTTLRAVADLLDPIVPVIEGAHQEEPTA